MDDKSTKGKGLGAKKNVMGGVKNDKDGKPLLVAKATFEKAVKDMGGKLPKAERARTAAHKKFNAVVHKKAKDIVKMAKGANMKMGMKQQHGGEGSLGHTVMAQAFFDGASADKGVMHGSTDSGVQWSGDEAVAREALAHTPSTFGIGGDSSMFKGVTGEMSGGSGSGGGKVLVSKAAFDHGVLGTFAASTQRQVNKNELRNVLNNWGTALLHGAITKDVIVSSQSLADLLRK